MKKPGSAPKPIKRNGRNYFFEDETDAYLEELAASRHRDGEDLSDADANNAPTSADAPTKSVDDTPAVGRADAATERIAATDKGATGD
jgi:hypothetical protein